MPSLIKAGSNDWKDSRTGVKLTITLSDLYVCIKRRELFDRFRFSGGTQIRLPNENVGLNYPRSCVIRR